MRNRFPLPEGFNYYDAADHMNSEGGRRRHLEAAKADARDAEKPAIGEAVRRNIERAKQPNADDDASK